MKKHSSPNCSERYKKPSSTTPIRPGFSAGMFSSQNSLFSSILQTKNKEPSIKHKTSQTQFEFQTYRSETPNQQSQPFVNKYLLGSPSKASKKKNNLLTKETIQTKFNSLLTSNKSADLDNIKLPSKENENKEEVPGILNNLKIISQQINQAKISSLNQQILQTWQKMLTTNCEKLAKIYKSEQNTPSKIIRLENSTTQESSIILEKLLAEERRNRLLVEEQTSKIIESQEAEIKSYVTMQNIQIDKIKQLELRLLEKANWKK